MKTIKELEKGTATEETIGYHTALKDVLKLIKGVIKNHTKMHYHHDRSCPQAIRDELKARITG